MISHAAGRRILSHGRGVRWQAAHEERHTRSPGPNGAASLAREARVLEHRFGSGLVTDENTTNPPPPRNMSVLLTPSWAKDLLFYG